MKIFKLLIVYILLIFGLPGILSAQSEVKIRGRVIDKSTGKPLPDTNISVVGTGFGGISDLNGSYRIENLPDGEYKLRVTYIGYITQISSPLTVSPDHIAIADFSLESAPFESEEIVISAERDLSELKLKSEQIEIIDAKKIREGNFRNVGEAIRTLPGVQITESGHEGSQSVSIRGSKSEHVLVLVDGARIAKPHGGSADLSIIPMSMIEEIIVVKGGSTAQFGPDALAGVVYIKTKQSYQQPLFLFQGTIGSFNSKGLQGTLSKNLNKLQLIFNYEQKLSDGNFEYENEREKTVERNNADFKLQHYLLKISHQTVRSLSRISMYANISKRGLPGFIYNLTPKTRSEDSQIMGDFFQRFDFSNTFNSSVHFSYQHYIDKDRQETWPKYNTKNTSESIFSDIKIKKHFSDNWFITSGISHKWDHGFLENVSHPLKRRPPRIIQEISTVHIYNEYSTNPFLLFDKITSTASYGHTWKKNKDEYSSPKFGLVITPNLPFLFSVKSNWSRSFHLPDFYDMYFDGYRISGNPDLKAERGEDFDTGVYFQLPFFGSTTWEINYFRNIRWDMIHWRKRFDDVFYPFNLEKVHLKGNEWKFEWSSKGDKLSLGANYTFLKAINKSGERNTDNKILTNKPVHTTHVYGTVNWNFFTIDIKNRWISRRYTREANTKWMNPYSVTDINLSGNFNIKNRNFSLRLGALNLLNEEYTIVELAPMPGRTVRISMEIKY